MSKKKQVTNVEIASEVFLTESELQPSGNVIISIPTKVETTGSARTPNLLRPPSKIRKTPLPPILSTLYDTETLDEEMEVEVGESGGNNGYGSSGLKRPASELMTLIARELIDLDQENGCYRCSLENFMREAEQDLDDPDLLIRFMLDSLGSNVWIEDILREYEKGSEEARNILLILNNYSNYLVSQHNTFITDPRFIPGKVFDEYYEENDRTYRIEINRSEVDGLGITLKEDLDIDQKAEFIRRIAEISSKKRDKRKSGMYATDLIVEIVMAIGPENIEKISIEEFKTDLDDDYSNMVRKKHGKQVGFYLRMLNRHLIEVTSPVVQGSLFNPTQPKKFEIPLIEGNIVYISPNGTRVTKIEPTDEAYRPSLQFLQSIEEAQEVQKKVEEDRLHFFQESILLQENEEMLRIKIMELINNAIEDSKISARNLALICRSLERVVGSPVIYKFRCGTIGIEIPNEVYGHSSEGSIMIIIDPKGTKAEIIRRELEPKRNKTYRSISIANGRGITVVNPHGEEIGNDTLIEILKKTGSKVMARTNQENRVGKIPYTSMIISERLSAKIYSQIYFMLLAQMRKNIKEGGWNYDRVKAYLRGRGLKYEDFYNFGGLFTVQDEVNEVYSTKPISRIPTSGRTDLPDTRIEESLSDVQLILGITAKYKNREKPQKQLSMNRIALPLYDLEQYMKGEKDRVGFTTRFITEKKDISIVNRTVLARSGVYCGVYGDPRYAKKIYLVEGIPDGVALYTLLKASGVNTEKISILTFNGHARVDGAVELISSNRDVDLVGCFDRDDPGKKQNRKFNRQIWQIIAAATEEINLTSDGTEMKLPEESDLKDVNDLLIWLQENLVIFEKLKTHIKDL